MPPVLYILAALVIAQVPGGGTPTAEGSALPAPAPAPGAPAPDEARTDEDAAGRAARAAAAAAARRQDEEAFRKALTGEMTLEERVQALEDLAKERADGDYADDALWVLGEAARRRGEHARVVFYWQFLVSKHPDVRLEEFTRGTEVYVASGLPQVVFFLDRTGQGYVREEGLKERLPGTDRVMFNTRPYNPVPMLVWQGLADSYYKLGKPRRALEACRKALDAAPAKGPWRRRLAERIRRLEPLAAAAQGEAESGPEPAHAPEGRADEGGPQAAPGGQERGDGG